MAKGSRLGLEVIEARNILIDKYLDKGIYSGAVIANDLVQRAEFNDVSHASICSYVSVRKRERGIELNFHADKTLVFERLKDLKKIVDSGDAEFKSICRKAVNLKSFKGLIPKVISGFITRHRGELGITTPNDDIIEFLGHNNTKKENLIKKIPDLDIDSKKLDLILSIYTPQLSYQESLKFSRFVESQLRPFIKKIEDKAVLTIELNSKVNMLQEELLELQGHKCPDANSDAVHMIKELSEEVKDLKASNNRLQLRDDMHAKENEQLRKRLISNGSAMVVHAHSVRSGAER